MSREIILMKQQIGILKRLLQLYRLLYNQLFTSKHKVKGIILHHTATPKNTTLTSIDNYHKSQGFSLSSKGWYIGYHYIIEEDGAITQARRDEEEGCHTKGYNKNYIGIGILGNFEVEQPSQAILRALEGLLIRLLKKYNLSVKQIKGHKDFSATACPGVNLVKWLAAFKAEQQ